MNTSELAGWLWTRGARVAHYFRPGDLASLCGLVLREAVLCSASSYLHHQAYCRRCREAGR